MRNVGGNGWQCLGMGGNAIALLPLAKRITLAARKKITRYRSPETILYLGHPLHLFLLTLRERG